MRFAVLALVGVLLASGPVSAQDRQQTLADIRQELTVLNVEIQRLKRELSTTGAPVTNLAGTEILDRIAAIEAELQRLTAETEALTYRIDRIVKDGTNRIGDLEFRLVELEGGDVSQLGETTTLGGDPLTAPVPSPDPQPGDDTELAIGERADFEAAEQALTDGDYQRAVDLLAQFDETYPGSPLGPRAHIERGKALEGLGDTREAARAYLESFKNDPTGDTAAEALYRLGAALGRLGQISQACVTLAEVGVRFPESPDVALSRQEMQSLGCP